MEGNGREWEGEGEGLINGLLKGVKGRRGKNGDELCTLLLEEKRKEI